MSTKYIYTFGLIMTVVVALVLAGFRTLTAESAALNEDIFNKREILATVAEPMAEAGSPIAELSDAEVLNIFSERVDQIVVNSAGEPVDDVDFASIDLAKEYKKPEGQRVYPVYKFNLDDEYYVFSVRGNGLWDAIWGNIALASDLNTVTGASFDHAGETPGLGAEIKDNAGWKSQFKGKKIYDGDQFVSIIVRKGGAVDMDHEVDGLSGATVTGDGVTKMLYNGLKAYQPYIEEQRAGGETTGMNMK
ncbi:Na+-transporting NADH:ubiquinone oxidoreductase subunit C [Neolewinella xylanilytica]|uniref:Na(+)-translocating NADH-quinone reductase subunit C n=1 Tax=Neolewinella xylanilytica TaxID=1514080 RepID=A0A2S6I0Y8_9BACT|nr:FMN-binding protein [Neolewinella xylanilytica]PPK84639.1 Na+-transporting NADH:ubiquinone oxidoreductase subunit C [Neolewinella xylanilytica]